MNANEYIRGRGRGRGRARGRFSNVVTIQGGLMGPPKRVPSLKSSSYSTSSSQRINWQIPQFSNPSTSTIINTVTSSRSHSSSEPESRVIIALAEGRGDAKCEVGIAAINIARPSLTLCQISDSQSYRNALTKINILNPNEILIPVTFINNNRLLAMLKQQFTDIKITGVPRSSFNKNTGLQYVKHLCVSKMNSIFLILQHRYYALAAASALLNYIENNLYISYARESIKVVYEEAEGITIIDVSTADRLELVACARPTMKKRYSCLLDVLNHCLTKVGLLSLRASILQPPCSIPEIEARLNCVTELLNEPETLTAIQVTLRKFNTVDQLLSLATVVPNQAQNCSERQLNYLLLLNSILEHVEPLRTDFEGLKEGFFVQFRATLSNPIFDDLKKIIGTMIHTDAHPARGQNGIMQRCFAIKSGLNSLLDVIRKTYSERLDDLGEYVCNLGKKYNLSLSLSNTHKKGFHIVLALNSYQKKTMKASDLPPEFIQVDKLSQTFTMKTQDLIDLSDRTEAVMFEILKMSNIMIYNLLLEIQKHVEVFYKLCEDIARLDLLQSLAVASASMKSTRPRFSNYLELVEARHPLLEFLNAVQPMSNTITASPEYNMHIITGPNGSGKSILIRQVILIQVMAQVGCYVPADSAVLRVSDRILARVTLEDNLACGASTFVLEMKEIQFFLSVVSQNTLIVVDELCRSTSLEKGTALAMSIGETLMATPAFIFFTTHFKLLTKLQDLHLNVKTWQMETLVETPNDNMVLKYTYRFLPGVTNLKRYGFFFAKAAWPADAIKYAEEALEEVSNTEKAPVLNTEQINPAVRLKYDLEATFKHLKTKKQLTRKTVNELLLQYQAKLQELEISISLSQLKFVTTAANTKNASSGTKMLNQKTDNFDSSNVFEPEVILQTGENSDSNPDYLNQFSLPLQSQLDRTSTPFSPIAFPGNPKQSTTTKSTSESLNWLNNDDLPKNPIEHPANQSLQYSDHQTRNIVAPEPNLTKTSDLNHENLFIDQNNQQRWPNNQGPFYNLFNCDPNVREPSFKTTETTNLITFFENNRTEGIFSCDQKQSHSQSKPKAVLSPKSKQYCSENVKLNLSSDNVVCGADKVFPEELSSIRDLEHCSEDFWNDKEWDSMVERVLSNSQDNSSLKLFPNEGNKVEDQFDFVNFEKFCTKGGPFQSKGNLLGENSNPFISQRSKGENLSFLRTCSVFEEDYKSDQFSFLDVTEGSKIIGDDNKENTFLFSQDLFEPDLNPKQYSFASQINNSNEIHILNQSQANEKLNKDEQRKVNNVTYSDVGCNTSFNDYLDNVNTSSKDYELKETKIQVVEEKTNEPPKEDPKAEFETETVPEQSPKPKKQRIATKDHTEEHVMGNSSPKNVIKIISNFQLCPPLIEQNLNAKGAKPAETDTNLASPNDNSTCEASQSYQTGTSEEQQKKKIKTRKHLRANRCVNKSSSSSDDNKNVPKRPKKAKFKPPYKKQPVKKSLPFHKVLKLSKKEIEFHYLEQNKKLLENKDLTQSLEEIMNRPSVKQLQQLKHIVSIQKTNSGILVIPTKETLKKTKKKFETPLKESTNFDVTLFSDKNVEKYEQLMNCNSDTKLSTKEDISPFQVIRSNVVKKTESTETTSESIAWDPIDTSKDDPIEKESASKGYYTQNKSQIENILNKYINQDGNNKRSQSQQSEAADCLNSSGSSDRTIKLI